ncbi:diguanylate cyclase domain-containing protein [Allisonella histaminiformans]|uniref:diguanylate cyclase domain-containing protein n=1 Tax=Allisonella histaminiformans TaxID=209880 RepID=UPI002A7FA474|nr:diguanylate cyclase [Allisonella histaminiformans]
MAIRRFRRKKLKLNREDMRKRLKKRTFVFSIGFLLCLLFLFSLEMMTSYERQLENERYKAGLDARIYSEILIKDLMVSQNASDTLDYIARDHEGGIHNFHLAASDLMRTYMYAIVWTPADGERQMYPEAALVSPAIDQAVDKAVASSYTQNDEHSMVDVPLGKANRKAGLIINTPVFQKDSSGARRYIGLASVVINKDKLFATTIAALHAKGYRYVLTRQSDPYFPAWQVVSQYGMVDDHAVSYAFVWDGCLWKLSLMPHDGWHVVNKLKVKAGMGLLAIFMAAGLFASLLSIYGNKRIAQYAAVHDPLTGLYNRIGFEKKVRQWKKANGNKIFLLAILDIDDFKIFNDRYGHLLGDQVLMHLAGSMYDIFKINSDTYMERNGGDEFLLFLGGTSIRELEKRLMDFSRASHVLTLEGKKYRYTLSIGYTVGPDITGGDKALYHQADKALYAVKESGKNNCRRYERIMENDDRTNMGFSLDEITDHIPGGVFICTSDREHRILYANKEAVRLAGYLSLRELMSHTHEGRFEELVHPDDRQELFIGREQGHPFRMLTQTGSPRYCRGNSRIVFNNFYGKVIYILVMGIVKEGKG